MRVSETESERVHLTSRIVILQLWDDVTFLFVTCFEGLDEMFIRSFWRSMVCYLFEFVWFVKRIYSVLPPPAHSTLPHPHLPISEQEKTMKEVEYLQSGLVDG